MTNVIQPHEHEVSSTTEWRGIFDPIGHTFDDRYNSLINMFVWGLVAALAIGVATCFVQAAGLKPVPTSFSEVFTPTNLAP